MIAPPAAAPLHDLLFDLVHASDVLCLWAGLAVGHDGLQYKLAEHVRLGLDLSRPAVEQALMDTWATLRQTETLMSQPAGEMAPA